MSESGMTMTKKKRMIHKEMPNPGGGGRSTSTSAISSTPSGPDYGISEVLPKEILHRILGFLEMDQFLIGTSLVSTKWRNLWKSVSTLKFPNCTSTTSSRRTTDDGDSVVDNGGGGGGGGGITNNVEKYQNFVDHVLRSRDSEASKIQIFKYDCDSDRRVSYDYLERLHKFIVSAAVNQGAQEIQIMGRYPGQSSNTIIHFNPSIFTSGELRKFTFELLTGNFLLKFPRSICCATQLTHLSLVGIILPEGDDDDDSNAAQLHLVCPVLEKLMICNCYSKHLKVLDISAPRLNDLFIANFFMISGGCDYLGGCRIEIRTPNLTSLAYSGCVYVDCFTENLPRITIANLCLREKRGGMVEKTTSFATKLLKGLTSANTLGLEGFEVFSQDTLKELLTPFTSLRTLKLKTSCKISSIHGIVHILNNCNSIENLVVEFCTMEGDEHLMLPQCRLSHLKLVCIKRLHGYKYEIELVKFLLKNSVVLKDIIIDTARDSPKRSIEENLKQFIEEEPLVRRSIKLHIL